MACEPHVASGYYATGMVKADLINRAMEANLDHPAAREGEEALFESLCAALERGDRVVLRRFPRRPPQDGRGAESAHRGTRLHSAGTGGALPLRVESPQSHRQQLRRRRPAVGRGSERRQARERAVAKREVERGKGRGDGDDEARGPGPRGTPRGPERGWCHQPGVAFPQGSVALKARAGSDPVRGKRGGKSRPFPGRPSGGWRGVAPSATLRSKAESPVREYVSEP